MKNLSMFKKTCLAASIAMLTACGSDGGGTASAIDTNTTVGVVTGFGSVFVNGVEYETDNIAIDIDGRSSLEALLGVGDVVVLQGRINADGVTGVATAISCVDELEGFVLDVSQLSNGIGTINVMGLIVTITLDTVFDGDDGGLATIDDVVAGAVVEVSGFPDGNGGILATRIEVKDPDTDDDVDFEVKGVISNLDTANSIFTISNLVVDYANVTGALPELVNGLLVEVETDAMPTADEEGVFTLVAIEIEIEDEDDIDEEEGDEVEIQGLISNINVSAGTFDFNGQTYNIDDVDFDGIDILSLEGVLITAEGHIDAEGNFVFEEVEEDHASEDELEGFVSAVDLNALTVTIGTGEDAVSFAINIETRIFDEQDDIDGVEAVRFFSLSDVAIGDFIEVKYFTDDTGKLIATELEREDAPSSY